MIVWQSPLVSKECQNDYSGFWGFAFKSLGQNLRRCHFHGFPVEVLRASPADLSREAFARASVRGRGLNLRDAVPNVSTFRLGFAWNIYIMHIYINMYTHTY